MAETLEKAFEEGKKWGIRVVIILTVVTTVYGSFFQKEKEARDYYRLLQPLVEESLIISEDAESIALANSVQIAKLQGQIQAMQQCSLQNVHQVKKETKATKTTKSKAIEADAIKIEDMALPKPKAKAHKRHYLPRKPWEQQKIVVPMEHPPEKQSERR